MSYKKLLMIFILFAFPLIGKTTKIYTGDRGNIANDGYDVITYFTEEQPIRGSSKHQLEYAGTVWYFVNEQNKNLFLQDPEKYIPAYGGYCVWAISHGRMTGGLPHLWKIFDGKLYLLCSEQAMKNWLMDPYYHIERANRKWQDMQ